MKRIGRFIKAIFWRCILYPVLALGWCFGKCVAAAHWCKAWKKIPDNHWSNIKRAERKRNRKRAKLAANDAKQKANYLNRRKE